MGRDLVGPPGPPMPGPPSLPARTQRQPRNPTRDPNANTRDRVAAVIRVLPGLNIQEIADALEIRRTAANHHIRRLIKERLVVTLRQGPHILHFPSNMPSTLRTIVSVLRIPSVRGLAEELFHDPQLPNVALARRLRITVRSVGRSLRILRHNDLAQLETHPGVRKVNLHPDLRIVLVRTLTPPAPAIGASGLLPPPDLRELGAWTPAGNPGLGRE